jgi:hypothetical protein
MRKSTHILYMLLTLCFFGWAQAGANPQEAEDKRPINERLTSSAWDAFNKHDYPAAITAADKCIKKFRDDADGIQARLEKENVVIPKGKVSDDQKKVIFENGPLNDVATCLFIKGQAAEKLDKRDDAKAAYTATLKYSYARAWDPQGWFWSPSEGAAEKLEAIK